VLRRSRGERTRRKSWPERVLSSNTKLKLKLKLVQADQTRPRCEKTLYQDKLHRVITRSLRIWPGRRLGSSRVGSAGRTACRHDHHRGGGRHRHRHHQPSSFRRGISRFFDNRLADIRRAGTFKVAGTNLTLESKELLTFGVSFTHACNRTSDQVRSFIYLHAAASMIHVLQLVYCLLPRRARVSSAPGTRLFVGIGGNLRL